MRLWGKDRKKGEEKGKEVAYHREMISEFVLAYIVLSEVPICGSPLSKCT